MIHVCEHHDEVLAHWRDEDLRGIRLAHVDFHDDLRGLLVDRRRNVAYPIRALANANRPDADPGDFLAHAVLEQRVESIRWIHDTPGGRGWDVGIVRYETDRLAWRDRRRHRRDHGPEYPLQFQELTLDRWDGPAAGELLSIDWDCFASILMDPDTIDARVEAFFDRLGPHVPETTWLAYSPEYSHDTLGRFREFATRLAKRFDQSIAWRSPTLEAGQLTPTDVDARLPRDLPTRLTLWLRRRGIC